MRSRLVATFAVLMMLVIAALAVPLARAYSSHRTGRLLLDRRADATRFAELADQAAREGDRATLNGEIARYAGLYGAAVRIRDRDGAVVAEAGAMRGPDRAATLLALSGRTTEDLPAVTPFGPRTVLVAEPAGRDAQVSGAVLVRAPTGRARRDVAVVWGVLALGALVTLGCAVLAARGLARWILRPVTELDLLTRALAEGRRDVRAVPGTGPGELRRLEERFNAMADAVSGSFERQQMFVNAASHELRTPLSTVMIQVENRRHEEALDELDRLVTLVDGLLELARVEHAPVVEDVDVAAELRARLAGWREPFEAMGLVLAVELPGTLRARAVPGAVARIADIALENAAKFVPPGRTVSVGWTGAERGPPDDPTGGRGSPPGKPAGRTGAERGPPDDPTGGRGSPPGKPAGRTGAERGPPDSPTGIRGSPPAGEVVLRIADDGPGLPAGDAAKASGRFWRSGAHTNVPGSGLGLAIAAELARACGGTLTVRANEPRGLVVELRLADQP